MLSLTRSFEIESSWASVLQFPFCAGDGQSRRFQAQEICGLFSLINFSHISMTCPLKRVQKFTTSMILGYIHPITLVSPGLSLQATTTLRFSTKPPLSRRPKNILPQHRLVNSAFWIEASHDSLIRVSLHTHRNESQVAITAN